MKKIAFLILLGLQSCASPPNAEQHCLAIEVYDLRAEERRNTAIDLELLAIFSDAAEVEVRQELLNQGGQANLEKCKTNICDNIESRKLRSSREVADYTFSFRAQPKTFIVYPTSAELRFPFAINSFPGARNSAKITISDYGITTSDLLNGVSSCKG